MQYLDSQDKMIAESCEGFEYAADPGVAMTSTLGVFPLSGMPFMRRYVLLTTPTACT